MDKTWIGCAPTNFMHGRPGGMKPEAIVIHIIVGSLKSAGNTFLDPNIEPRRSAHYGVGRDGRVHQFVAEEDTAFHAGIVDRPTAPLVAVRKAGINPNRYTIGIEHEGLPDQPWPAAMFETSAALVAEAARRWSIPIKRERIIMHREIRASKSCPGFGVNIDQLVDRAAQFVAPAASGGTRITEGFPRAALVTARVRLRSGRPSTLAPVLSVFAAGTSVAVSALVQGDAPAVGTSWWCEVNGGKSYFWAGASDIALPA